MHNVTVKGMSRENKGKFQRILAEGFQSIRGSWKLDVQVPFTDFEMLSLKQTMTSIGLQT